MKWKKACFGIFIFSLLLGLDQVTKHLAVIHLKGQEPFPFIQDVFELQYLENFGAAFGVLQNQRILLLAVTSIVLLLLCFLYWKIPAGKRYFPMQCTIVLIAAGAVGNLIDRLLQGYVVDFFYFKLIDFPIFNVADCYVVIAAFFAVVLIGFYYKEEELTFWKKEKK
ncbi:signal peptidase II [bacterium D16-51]|nr:signal peptidase II [bacterium D16-59]RKI60170.1 signal peptidase II [bacterium D16-51]